MSARRAAATSGNPFAVAANTREFAFSDNDFQTLTRLAYEHAGISLAESKQNLIYSRLSRRLRALQLNSFRANHCTYLAANASKIENFINTISTSHTKFLSLKTITSTISAATLPLHFSSCCPEAGTAAADLVGRLFERRGPSTPSRWSCITRFGISPPMMSGFLRRYGYRHPDKGNYHLDVVHYMA